MDDRFASCSRRFDLIALLALALAFAVPGSASAQGPGPSGCYPDDPSFTQASFANDHAVNFKLGCVQNISSFSIEGRSGPFKNVTAMGFNCDVTGSASALCRERDPGSGPPPTDTNGRVTLFDFVDIDDCGERPYYLTIVVNPDVQGAKPFRLYPCRNSGGSGGDRPLVATVKPGRVRAGDRTCFRFDVERRNGDPVRGALARLDGERDRTNADGIAKICTVLENPGTELARVSKDGFRTERLSIRVVNGGDGSALQRLRADVTPDRVRARQFTCFRFDVERRDGSPVRNAVALLNGKRNRTNANGFAMICTALDGPGIEVATIRRKGFRTKRLVIEVVRAAPGGDCRTAGRRC